MSDCSDGKSYLGVCGGCKQRDTSFSQVFMLIGRHAFTQCKPAGLVPVSCAVAPEKCEFFYSTGTHTYGDQRAVSSSR